MQYVQVKLAALWAALMLTYLLGDVRSDCPPTPSRTTSS